MRDNNSAFWMQLDHHSGLAETCAEIRLLVLNVDGVLTDGRKWQDSKGKLRRRFSIRDMIALKRWRKSGGRVAVITEILDAQIKTFVDTLEVDFFFEDCKDKSTALRWILQSQGLRPSSVATFASHGSDLFLAQQGAVIFAAPSAGDEFLRSAHFVTRLDAGEGAVAEACALLFRTRAKIGRVGKTRSH